jgi:hypothetical protein
MGVEEGLLLDGIALRSSDVSPGHVELAAAVVTDFAHTGLAVGDRTTMSAGEAAHAVLVEPLVKMRIGFADSIIENTAEGGHGFLLSILTPVRDEASAFGLRGKGVGGCTHSAGPCPERAISHPARMSMSVNGFYANS